MAQSIDDRLGAVLADELSNQATGDDDVDLGRSWVRVRCIEAAGREEAEGHAEGGTDQSWEAGAIGEDGVAACGKEGVSGCEVVLGGVGEYDWGGGEE